MKAIPLKKTDKKLVDKQIRRFYDFNYHINLISYLSRETEGLGPMTSGNLQFGKVPLPAE
jgi:hypothetical protein